MSQTISTHPINLTPPKCHKNRDSDRLERPCSAGGVEGSRTGSFSSVKEDHEGLSQSFRISLRNQGLRESSSCSLPALVPGLDGIYDGEFSLKRSTVRATDGALDDGSDEREGKQLSTFESLPCELLEQILENLALDVPPNEPMPRNTDLVACLLTSRLVNAVTTTVLYRQITIPHSYVFSKLLNHLEAHPELGRLVRRLDLSHFSSVGLGRTREMNAEIQNFTSKTFHRSLQLMPNIKELLLQEHLDHDIDAALMHKIFHGLPKLRALDFCACFTSSFASAFTATIMSLDAPTELSIENLSLHECGTIPSADLERLLSRLPRLKILDVYHTRVTDTALHSIRDTARLTHLNIGLCTNLSGGAVAEFLVEHPAARQLVYLNMYSDVACHRLLRRQDLDVMLPSLPSSLRSLNLGGAQISADEHMPHLLRLSTHLEELGLAYSSLTMEQLNSFFQPGPARAAEQREPCTLCFLDVSNMESVTQRSIFTNRPAGATSRVDAGAPSPVPFLLGQSSLPLEVLEVGAKTLADLKRSKDANSKFGWTVSECGRRGWYVRERGSRRAGAYGADDPAGGRLGAERWWKMGCRSWGMKKVPVMTGDVGGIYGHCMFKK